MTQDDSSIFSYDGDGDPDTFSLQELTAVVNSHFSSVCSLEKLAEGGYHKVYDIVWDDGTPLGVVRVAAPAFPKDKIESEVATLKFLAAHTHIPVPTVYAWNSDASNPVGAEYMIMQKSFLLAELHFLSHHRSVALSEIDGEDEETAVIHLEQGERVLQKALELCSVYPGDVQIHRPIKPFSLRFDDFRLSNIMIDESGRVTGYIDFEGATIAPPRECALLPRWLQDPDDSESTYEGGSAESRQTLRALFLEKVGHEWKLLYEQGKLFRLLSDRLPLQVGVWASDDMEAWVDERLAWAKNHPGVGFPE